MIDRVLRNAAKAPDADAGFGTIADTEEVLIDSIESNLMLIGTLTEDAIDWKKVVEDSAALLKTCTHIRAFQGSIFSLKSNVSNVSLRQGLALAATLFDNFWPDLHPTGKKFQRIKNKVATDIVGQLAQLIAAVKLAERKIDDAAADAARVLLDILTEKADAIDFKAYADAVGDLGNAAPDPTPQPDTTGPIARELDAKGRAELRRDIKSIADRISAHDPTADVAFSLRSYAAWLEFKGKIPSEAGKIAQQPMPANIEDEFKAGLSQPSDGMLRKLEDRLFTSPDWFEGQKLAFDYALGLGHAQVAHAVHTRAARRVQSNPELGQLAYANGRAILSDQIKDWLAKLPMTGAAASTDQAGASAISAPEDKDLTQGLIEADMVLNQATSGRQTFAARITMLEALSDMGLTTQVKLMAKSLVQEIEAQTIRDWDPDMFDRLGKLLS